MRVCMCVCGWGIGSVRGQSRLIISRFHTKLCLSLCIVAIVCVWVGGGGGGSESEGVSRC